VTQDLPRCFSAGRDRGRPRLPDGALPPPTSPGARMSAPRPVDRRTVLGGVAVAGLAVVGVPALASCSSGSSGGAGSTTTKVKTSDVPVGGGVIESTTGVVVVQPTTG